MVGININQKNSHTFTLFWFLDPHRVLPQILVGYLSCQPRTNPNSPVKISLPDMGSQSDLIKITDFFFESEFHETDFGRGFPCVNPRKRIQTTGYGSQPGHPSVHIKIAGSQVWITNFKIGFNQSPYHHNIPFNHYLVNNVEFTKCHEPSPLSPFLREVSINPPQMVVVCEPGFPTLSTVYPSPNKAQGPLGSTRVPRLRAARCKGISVSSVLQLMSARAWRTLGLILFFGTIIYYHVVIKCYPLVN